MKKPYTFQKPYINLTKNLTRFNVGIIDYTHFLTCFLVGPHALYIYLKKEKNKGSGFLMKTGNSLKLSEQKRGIMKTSSKHRKERDMEKTMKVMGLKELTMKVESTTPRR